MTWTERIEKYIREGRTVSGGKGGDTANAQRQQELDMQKQAFAQQQSQIADLKNAFSKYTTQNIGFDPSQLSSMRSQFLNSNSSTFNQAGQMVRSALGARGSGTGQLPAGGDYTRGLVGLLAGRAGSQSQGLLGINIQNQQQALQNRFNAGNLLSGNAAIQTGTQGVAGSGASSALSSYITAQNNDPFMSALGGTLGKGLGTGILGAAGQAASYIPT